jgi:signal transduction histidine kinase
MTPPVWRPFRDWTLGTKLATTFFLVVAGVVGLVSLAVIRHERTALDAELRKRCVDLVEHLGALSVDLVLQDDLWGLYKVVRDVAGRREGSENVVAYAVVLDRDGRVLAHSDPARYPMGEPMVPDPVGRPPGPIGAMTLRTGRLGEAAIHDIALPIVLDKQVVGIARVGVTTRQLEATVGRLTRDILLIGSLLGALGIVLGFVISRRMTRPLRQLSQAVEDIGQGRLREAVPVRTTEKDEIGRLADRFNVMAARLAENETRLIQSERLASVGELAGALAHEIRNPLGALVAAAKMLRSGSPQSAAYDRPALLGVIADEAARLDRILTEFLAFARPRVPHRQAQSVNGLVQEVLGSLQLDELAVGRTLDTRLDPELPPVAVDADQIKQVLWNVVRNALEASPPTAPLQISTGLDDGHVLVEVVDGGHGIPVEHQARLFEPFQTTKLGGSGLGLAIAHRIVMAHHGRIDVTSVPGAGTRVQIRLPRPASA